MHNANRKDVMTKRMVALSIVALMTACAVQQNPAKTRIMTPISKIEYHCPPGQAKKGKC